MAPLCRGHLQVFDSGSISFVKLSGYSLAWVWHKQERGATFHYRWRRAFLEHGKIRGSQLLPHQKLADAVKEIDNLAAFASYRDRFRHCFDSGGKGFALAAGRHAAGPLHCVCPGHPPEKSSAIAGPGWARGLPGWWPVAGVRFSSPISNMIGRLAVGGVTGGTPLPLSPARSLAAAVCWACSP